MKIAKEWKSEKPNPDEDFLKAEFNKEAKELESSISAEKAKSEKKHANIELLVKASGLSKQEIDRRINQSKADSKASLQRNERQLLQPAIDIEARHSQDRELAKRASDQLSPKGNPSWANYIWSPSNSGAWGSWNGEAAQEGPSAILNHVAERVDPRVQAVGEGWSDGDFSDIHAYLVFTFTPPSWGHLYVHVSPWFHGYYHLYSDDEWYNSVYARALLQTWVRVHQNFWRPMQYHSRFDLGGYELHPTRYGRIDTQYSQAYYTDVGAGDLVTILVGAHLHSFARACGSYSSLDFQAGNANYIHVPNVYWYLHR